MYKNTHDNAKKSKSIKTKALVKFYLKGLVLKLALMDVLICYLMSTLSKLLHDRRIPKLIPVILIVQAIFCAYYFIKEIKKVRESCNCKEEKIIDFNQESMIYKTTGIEINVKWQAIRNIQVFKEYFIVNYSIFGAAPLVFVFSDIDGNKEDVIAEIKKYKKVKRC